MSEVVVTITVHMNSFQAPWKGVDRNSCERRLGDRQNYLPEYPEIAASIDQCGLFQVLRYGLKKLLHQKDIDHRHKARQHDARIGIDEAKLVEDNEFGHTNKMMPGIMRLAMKMEKMIFLPGNRSRANAKPARDAKKTLVNVCTTVTNMLFDSHRPKGKSCQTCL